jgi:antitoxin Phd
METVTASQAKKEFGRVLESAMLGRSVVITKHDAPKAVLISFAEFEALSQRAEKRINTLTHEFDALFDRMQTRKALAGMKAAFHASPKQIARAAVAVARKGR